MLASVAGALRNTRLSISPLSLKDPSLGVFSKVQPFCDFAWFYVASETRALRLAVLAALFLWIQAQHQDLSEVGRKSSRTTNGKTSVHRTRSKTVYHSRGELDLQGRIRKRIPKLPGTPIRDHSAPAWNSPVRAGWGGSAFAQRRESNIGAILGFLIMIIV